MIVNPLLWLGKIGEGDEDLELIKLSDSLETLPLHEIGTEEIGEGEEVFGGDTNPFVVSFE